MPFKPRLRLPRRQSQLRVHTIDQLFSVWCPHPDDRLAIEEFGDAASLAFDINALPVRREALVLLDERRCITAILLDPPAEVGVWVGRCTPPGAEQPFSNTLCIVLRDHVPVGPPTDDDRSSYHALRRAHMAQGLLLLDTLITDGDTVRSMAIGCDPDPVWFDEFLPLDGDG
jgi:hypothetical protein